jgi:hypothetical protein
VDRLVLDNRHGFFAMSGQNGSKALRLDDFAEGFAHPAIVVGDENRKSLGFRHAA